MIHSQLCTLSVSATRCSEDVCNQQGEKIGKVINFRVDLENRSIAYVVLSFNEAFGMGDSLFALPWQALKVDSRTLCFVLNVEEEVLQNAPCINPDRWREQSDQDFVNQIYTHYGYDPFYDETGHVHQQAGVKI